MSRQQTIETIRLFAHWAVVFAAAVALPGMVSAVQQGLLGLQQSFSDIVSEDQLAEWSSMANAELSRRLLCQPDMDRVGVASH